MKISFVAILILLLLQGCNAQQRSSAVANFIKYPGTSDSIRITGRVQQSHDAVKIYWQGTSILFRFKGSAAKAIFNDERGENYFNVVIDKDSVRYIRLRAGLNTYLLAENLSDGEHTVEVFKRTEWDKGKTIFHGLQIEGGSLVPLPQPRKRTIEFFGNSITSGYANEDFSGKDSPDSTLTNNYNSYAAITARHFDANFYCTSKSGIGIMVSWFPLIMPELYDRLDPTDSTVKWDFHLKPDVVVINLLQNDSWLVKKPEHASFKKRFGQTPPTPIQIISAYKNFVATVRKVYPASKIICVLGPMDITKPGSPWPGYVQQALNEISDPNIISHFFRFTSVAGHPRVEEHRRMADELIELIAQQTKW